MARTPQLDVGDQYEYSLSVLVKPSPGSDVWIRAQATGTVREGESGQRAARRIENFVEDRINRKVAELLEAEGDA